MFDCTVMEVIIWPRTLEALGSLAHVSPPSARVKREHGRREPVRRGGASRPVLGR